VRVGVHIRSVQTWESGASVPSADRLQPLIAALFEAGGFSTGREMDEAAALWLAADRASTRQHPPFDRHWFAEFLAPPDDIAAGDELGTSMPPTSTTAPAPCMADWSDAPDPIEFVGRATEVATLSDWVVRERRRLAAVHGMGGVGKSLLVARVARDVAGQFERVYWRNLRNAPSFSEWCDGAIRFLSDDPRATPVDPTARTEALLSLLRARPCLVVLDGFEALLQAGSQAGDFLPDCTRFAAFVRAAADCQHQSCVLLTSRQVPLAMLQTGARVLELGGLDCSEARGLLRGLTGTDGDWEQLVARYGGNPHALKLVANSIREVFGGGIAEFMAQVPTGTMLSGLRHMLEGQCDRLSPLEREVVDLLAGAQVPISFVGISAELAPRVTRSSVLEAIEALRHRSLVECKRPGGEFKLQSVVWEYVTDRAQLAPAMAR
jgi:hypothetical protein